MGGSTVDLSQEFRDLLGHKINHYRHQRCPTDSEDTSKQKHH